MEGGRQCSGRYPLKDASFDIQSLADQLYRSRSTIPDGPEPEKIYFSENPVSDLLKEGIKQLHWAFNQLLQKTGIDSSSGGYGEDVATGPNAAHPIEFDVGANGEVNELFSMA